MSNPSPQPQHSTPNGIAPSGEERDWTDQVTDLIVDSVDRVRTATTEPLLLVARGIVYGIIILIVAIPVLILFGAFALRFLDAFLPGDVWGAWAILSVLFLLAGTFFWRKKGTARLE